MKIPEDIKERLKIVYDGQSISTVTLKPDVRVCEYCEDIIDKKQTITTALVKHPYPHTRTRCNLCNRLKNPVTGEFDCNQADINRFYKENNKKI